jgi:hypothetical protein
MRWVLDPRLLSFVLVTNASGGMAGGEIVASAAVALLATDYQNVFVPAGLTTDGERLWVGDWATGMVWEPTFEGREVVSTVPVVAGLAKPKGKALDGHGGLFVVETGARQLSQVAVGPSGAIYVSENGRNVLTRITQP